MPLHPAKAAILIMLIREYTPVSEEEYLRLEAHSPVRHEYVNGEMFAMTGGTLRHNTIALNLAVALRNGLRAGPCRVYINDVRVRIEKTRSYYYPDLLVTCTKGTQPVDLAAVTVDDPVLLVEVLSQGTEAIDRREKLLSSASCRRWRSTCSSARTSRGWRFTGAVATSGGRRSSTARTRPSS
jgi:Uma2 family endonuclease